METEADIVETMDHKVGFMKNQVNAASTGEVTKEECMGTMEMAGAGLHKTMILEIMTTKVGRDPATEARVREIMATKAIPGKEVRDLEIVDVAMANGTATIIILPIDTATKGGASKEAEIGKMKSMETAVGKNVVNLAMRAKNRRVRQAA